MNFVLADDQKKWKSFLPLTFTKPLSEIRIGILTIKEKWDLHLNASCSYFTEEYLSKKFKNQSQDGFFINSSICPNKKIVAAILELKAGQVLYSGDLWLAFNGTINNLKDPSKLLKIEFSSDFLEVKNVWDIFQKNGIALTSDFEILISQRKSKQLSDSVTVVGNRNLIFLEEGAVAEACTFNTLNGPIYLAKDSEVMEGCLVRGPFALGEHSVLKMGAKVYGPTTIGLHSKVGGEVSNSVIFGYSNKAHDGFIGNSVIGEWCNLGADTNSSNLKNNYSNVKVYSYLNKMQIDSGLQFCGLIMGDYSKSGINTMFNTGTVVGIGSNIYGGGFPPTSIANFSWGGSEGFETYNLDKLLETTEKVYERRNLKLSTIDKEILKFIYDGKVEV